MGMAVTGFVGFRNGIDGSRTVTCDFPPLAIEQREKVVGHDVAENLAFGSVDRHGVSQLD